MFQRRLFSLIKTIECIPMVTINPHLIKGRKYARNSKYVEAIREFDLLLASGETAVDGLYYRGCAKLHLEQYETAIDDFNSAMSSMHLSDDYDLQASYKCGYAHYKLYQFDSALNEHRRFLTKCQEKSRNDLKHKGFFAIGCTHTALNQHEQAIRYFGDAIDSSKDNSEDRRKLYYLHRGRALACCARFSDAAVDLNIVIDQSNDSFIKGCAYNELGQHQHAIQQFDHFLENKLQATTNTSVSAQISEDYVRFRRGLSHARIDSHNAALEDYQYILEHSKEETLSPIIDRVLFRKGISCMALNDTYNALISFNKSTSINDQQSDVFYARGMLQFTLGRHDAAVYDQRRAMQIGGLHAMSPSIFKIFYHTHDYGNDTIARNFYQEKLNAAEKELEESKQNRSYQVECHRLIAEYSQLLAPYTHDSEVTHQKARPHIEAALKSSPKACPKDIVINAVHQLREAQILCKKYPDGVASEHIVKQFINSTTNSIMQMSQTLERCSTPQDWKDLFDIFADLLAKSRTNVINPFAIFRYEMLKIQLEKAEMMKKTIEKFKESPHQQEFYKLLVIRLCNLFDGTRAATTGIFQHALTGTLNKVSWGFMILGKVFEHIPAAGKSVTQVLGFVEKGLKKLDEERIQNVLYHIGCLETAQKLNETADEIAEKLTIMYKWQIEQFPLSDTNFETTNRDMPKESCGCTTCCSSCIGCLTRAKNYVTNEREDTIIQKIAKYAISLMLGRLIKTNTHEINNIIDLRDSFLNAVCNLPYKPALFLMVIATKIEPVATKTDDDNWDTHRFFRGPAIQFQNGDRRADKHMNNTKYGYREPLWNEEEWNETNPEKLDDLGLNKEETEEEV